MKYNKKLLAGTLLVCLLTAAIVCFARPRTTTASSTETFADIPNLKYYTWPVSWAVENKIASGVTKKYFNPDDAINRAQMITFLYRIAGSPDVQLTKQYIDMPKYNKEYMRAISWALQEGIAMGTSDYRFNPYDDCTRVQILVFLYRYAGQPPVTITKSFVDMPDSRIYMKAISWAVEKGIVLGDTSNRIYPHRKATRAEAVTFLYRAFAQADYIPTYESHDWHLTETTGLYNIFYCPYCGYYYRERIRTGIPEGFKTPAENETAAVEIETTADAEVLTLPPDDIIEETLFEEPSVFDETLESFLDIPSTTEDFFMNTEETLSIDNTETEL